MHTPDETNAETLWSYNAQMTNFSVYISSEIEASYKKVTVGSGPLPADWYQKDEFGNPMIGTFDIGIGHKIRSEPQQDVYGTTYAVRCERNSDGSMTVESAASLRLNTDTGTATPTPIANATPTPVPHVWKQWPILQAHALGYSQPQYHWDATGMHTQPTPTPPVTTQPYYSWSDLDHIDLSESDYVLGSIQSQSLPGTTATVHVREGDPAFTSSPELQNSYTINWHPIWQVTQNLPDGPKIETELYDFSATPFQGGNSLSYTLHQPRFDWNALVDNIVPIAKLAPGGDKLGDLVEAYKGAMNLTKMWDDEETITVQSNGIGNFDEGWEDAVQLFDHTHVDGWTPTIEQHVQQGNNSDRSYFDCYIFRVRIHHQKNALADEYDEHGFCGSNRHLSNDVTDQIGNFNYYVRPGAAKPTFSDIHLIASG